MIVLIGMGPSGTGMQETAQITTALRYLPWGKHVALITDGRFSGFSTGACIGHVGPEALDDGPIGRVRDGDLIEIVIDRHTLTGTVDLVGAGGRRSIRRLRALLSQTVRASRPRSARRLPDDSRLWAALQRASGGTWAGCIYDVDRIVAQLDAARPRRMGNTTHDDRLWGLRWWMMGLLMVGVDHQLPHAQHAGGRGADGPERPGHHHAAVSWILSAFQVAIMLQPICGYVMDTIGLKLGFAIFAIAWSFISMAHGLAGNWQTLFGLRALLGFAEGSANPAGMKATSEWFPAPSAASPAASSTWARRSARCSPRRSSRGRS